MLDASRSSRFPLVKPRLTTVSSSVIGATTAGSDWRSHHINTVTAASRRPLAAVAEVAVVAGRPVHVRRLQLHLTRSDGGVQLHLSPVYHIKHEADADENLHDKTQEFRLFGSNAFYKQIDAIS